MRSPSMGTKPSLETLVPALVRGRYYFIKHFLVVSKSTTKRVKSKETQRSDGGEKGGCAESVYDLIVGQRNQRFPYKWTKCSEAYCIACP